MIPDELFMWTVKDLDERLELGRGEYDAFCMAWLLRKLLENGQRSLMAIVAENRSAPVRFTVRDGQSPPYGFMSIYPEEPGAATRELDQRELRKHIVTRVPGDEDAKAAPYEISVSKLVVFLANNMGAVHVTAPRARWEKALWNYCWRTTSITPKGQYSGGVACLIDVARVVREGVEPLRQEISPEVWPEHLPEFARKVRRLRPDAW